MAYTIRRAGPEDYQALSDLHQAVYGWHMSPDEIREDEALFPDHCKHARWMAEAEGEVVASGRYWQFPGRYHPQKFKIDIDVHPDYRRQGIGGELYALLMEALKPFDPIGLNTTTREDYADAIGFVERRGFVEAMRTWEQKLLLDEFDGAAFAGAVAKATAQGYELVYLKDLADDPDHVRKLYDLVMEIRADVPGPEPASPIPFENWVQRSIESADLWGWLVAVKDGAYVGATNLFTTAEEEGMLHCGLTGVQRNHRGVGLSYALKVKSLLDAKAAGFKSVLTWNESNNRPMLAVNARVGFVRQPAWIDYNKVL